MHKEGIVIKEENGIVKVAVHQTSGCGGGCKTCGGCDTPQVFVDLPNYLKAKTGDIVRIRANNSKFFLFSFMIYFIPLAFFVGGIFTSYLYLSKIGNEAYEFISLLVGLIALAISALIIRAIDKKIGKSDSSLMELEEIIGSIVD